MPGKRYKENEIARLVELRKGGKTFEEILDIFNTEFPVKRNIRSLKITYKNHREVSVVV